MFEYSGNGFANEFVIPREFGALPLASEIQCAIVSDGLSHILEDNEFSVDGRLLILNEPLPIGATLTISKVGESDSVVGKDSLFSCVESAKVESQQLRTDSAELRAFIDDTLGSLKSVIDNVSADLNKRADDLRAYITSSEKNIRAERESAARIEAKRVEELLRGWVSDAEGLLVKNKEAQSLVQSYALECKNAAEFVQTEYRLNLDKLLEDAKHRLENIVREAVGSLDIKCSDRLGAVEKTHAEALVAHKASINVSAKIDSIIKLADNLSAETQNTVKKAQELNDENRLRESSNIELLMKAESVLFDVNKAVEYAKSLLNCEHCGVRIEAEKCISAFRSEIDAALAKVAGVAAECDKKHVELSEIHDRLRRANRAVLRGETYER